MSPFKDEHIKEFKRRMGGGDAVRYAGSGERWWRNFKRRNFHWLADRIPQLVETQRADAKLTEGEWKEFFDKSVLPALDTVGGDPRLIWNMDESPFMLQHLSNTGRRVWVRKGTKKAWRKRGRNRTHVTLMGCVSAAGEPLIPVFKPLKTYFHKLQHASIQLNERLCAHTLFVRNVTTAWVKAMKKECITNAWRACGLVPFDPQYFVDHIPSHRLRQGRGHQQRLP